MSEFQVDADVLAADYSAQIFLTAFVVIFIGCVVGGIVYFIFAIIEFLKEFATDDDESESS
jgi:hypothetical protein